MRLSTVLLLVFSGIVAGMIKLAFRRRADLHTRYWREPRGTIDHATNEALLSD